MTKATDNSTAYKNGGKIFCVFNLIRKDLPLVCLFALIEVLLNVKYKIIRGVK